MEIRDFLSELKIERLLINSDLEEAIRSQVDRNKILDTEQQEIIREALGEMNRRELGVYSTAIVIITAINCFPVKK